jgi:hypothetical protein
VSRPHQTSFSPFGGYQNASTQKIEARKKSVSHIFLLFQLSALPQGVQRRVSTDLCVVNPLALTVHPLETTSNQLPTGVSVTDAKGWTTHSSFGLQTTRTTRTNIFMVGNFSCHRIK